LLDGSVWELVRGEDFQSRLSSFVPTHNSKPRSATVASAAWLLDACCDSADLDDVVTALVLAAAGLPASVLEPGRMGPLAIGAGRAIGTSLVKRGVTPAFVLARVRAADGAGVAADVPERRRRPY
jgi:hypothetical protein